MTSRAKKKRLPHTSSPTPSADGPSALAPPGDRAGLSVRLMVATVLAAVALAVYVPTLDNAFVNWDDGKYVVNNPHIAEGLSWKTAGWALTTDRASNWHPLTWLSHALDVQLYGVEPGNYYSTTARGHHATSLILHALNAALLFWVLERLTRRLWPSAIAAAFFALHPLHVESVSWIAERKDVLSTLFMLLAVWAYVAWVARAVWWRYVLIVVAFAAALGSKPMVVTLPFVLLLLDWWPLGRLSWKRVAEKAPLFAMTVVSCIVTYTIQNASGATDIGKAIALDDRVANALYATMMYAVRTLWPSPLVPLHPLPVRGGPVISALAVAGAMLFLLGITAAVFQQRRRRPYLLMGWLFYLGTLVPVIGLVQVGRQVMAERYTYVPLVGLSVAGVWLVADLVVRHRAVARVAGIVAAAALLGCATLSWRQQAVWANGRTLWEHVVEIYPRNSVAQNNLGSAYKHAAIVTPERRDEFLRKASACYEKAIEANPRLLRAHWNLGQRLLAEGRIGAAAARFEKVVALNPQWAQGLKDLGRTLAMLGRAKRAESMLRRSLALKPRDVGTRIYLATLLLEAGRYEEAIAEAREAVRLKPSLAIARQRLGEALTRGGHADEGRRHLDEAARLRKAGAAPPSQD